MTRFGVNPRVALVDLLSPSLRSDRLCVFLSPTSLIITTETTRYLVLRIAFCRGNFFRAEIPTFLFFPCSFFLCPVSLSRHHPPVAPAVWIPWDGMSRDGSFAKPTKAREWALLPLFFRSRKRKRSLFLVTIVTLRLGGKSPGAKLLPRRPASSLFGIVLSNRPRLHHLCDPCGWTLF